MRRTRQSTKRRLLGDGQAQKSAARATIVERNERQRDIKVGRNDRERRRRDKARAKTMTIAGTSGNRGPEQKWLGSNLARTDDATGVARIIATTTTMTVIAATAIATASEVHKAPTNATDVTDATDVEVATISQTADTTQVAENAADADGHDSQANKPEKA
jgi:hypothetical protein